MIFFFEKFWYAWDTHAEVIQKYKYSKSSRYGYGSIFEVPGLHRMELAVEDFRQQGRREERENRSKKVERKRKIEKRKRIKIILCNFYI